MPPLYKILGFETYMDCFKDRIGKPRSEREVNIDTKYSKAMSDDDWYRFSALGNDLEAIDTSLEALLAFYYSPEIVAIQPAEAARLLPQNDKISGLRLGKVVLRELTDVKFFNPQDTAAIGRYEGMVKFIQDKHGLSRAEIDNYYHDAVRAEISNSVNEQFGKILFQLRVPQKGAYTATLTYNLQTKQYILSYERPSVENDDKTLSAPTLDALLLAVSKNADFDQASVITVKEQASLIPAVVYDNLKTTGEDGLQLVKDTISNFYISPTTENFNALVGIYARYWRSGALRNGSFADKASSSFYDVLYAYSPELASLVSKTVMNGNSEKLASYPVDQRFNVFSIVDPRFDVFGGR